MKYRLIPGYPYRISETGVIKSTITKKILSTWVGNHGYLVTFLSNALGKRQALVHRLVAETWLGQCPPKHVVNHIDENKTNNNWQNLEYVTRRQNTHHSIRRRGRLVLTETQVTTIRRRVVVDAPADNAGVADQALRQVAPPLPQPAQKPRVKVPVPPAADDVPQETL